MIVVLAEWRRGLCGDRDNMSMQWKGAPDVLHTRCPSKHHGVAPWLSVTQVLSHQHELIKGKGIINALSLMRLSSDASLQQACGVRPALIG